MNRARLFAFALLALFAIAGWSRAGELEDALRRAIDPALKRLEKPENKPAPAEPANAQDKDAQQGAKEDAPASQSSTDILPFGRVSTQDEVRIGRQIAGNLLGAAPLVKDSRMQQYVNSVGRWVASQSDRPDLKWTFGVIDSDDLNAFAAPGGYIFITRGLYAVLEDEAQLAGVLAHEIGHVQQKHHLKVLQKQQLLNIGTRVLGREVGGGDKNVQRVIGSGAEIVARGLDKSAEFEADRIGVVLAARAGYDPWGLPEVLQALGSLPKTDSSVALLFKTHPAPEERLTQLGDAMGERLDNIKSGRTLAERFYRGRVPASTGAAR